MKNLLSVLVVIMLISCGSAESGNQKEQEKIRIRELKRHKCIQYFNEGGMNYIVVHSTNSSGGVSVVNLTLDSLKTEYYKKELQRIK